MARPVGLIRPAARRGSPCGHRGRTTKTPINIGPHAGLNDLETGLAAVLTARFSM